LANSPDIMPRYTLFISNQSSRIRYPDVLDLPDLDAARGVARRVVKVFTDVVPYWSELSSDQQSDFVVEIVDEAGELLLTIPFREAEAATPGLTEATAHEDKEAPSDRAADGAS
jgi:hypothetical protein